MEILENSKTNCTGCKTCLNICPQGAITVKEKYDGFLYPEINDEVCTECGLCKIICPINKEESDMSRRPDIYVYQNLDDEIRMNSSSGGAFSLLSKFVIDRGGIVFGASYVDKFEVAHIEVCDIESLKRLCESKYVQSTLGDTFKRVKMHLSNNKLVLFSGTPCQIEGLLSYLNNVNIENLITLDIVCHGVPSPGIYRLYVNELQKKYKKISKISFRNKKWGYAASSMAVVTEDGKVHTTDKLIKSYKKLYFDGLISRKSYYNCKFKNIFHKADFTLFDCWHINEFKKQWDDDKGTSYIVANNKKAVELLKFFSDSRILEVDYDTALRLDGKMIVESDVENGDRNNLFADYANGCSYDYLIKRYGKLRAKEILATYLKPVLYKSQIIKIYKRMLSN